jgi:DNA-binding NarL/FixJ family response regulator
VSEFFHEPSIRVFLLIENRLLREALSRLLHKRAEFQVVGVCGPDEISIGDLDAANCDVLAIDFFDPDYLTSPASPDSKQIPEVKTVLIGMDADSDRFLEAVRAGVNSYLLKDASAAEVIAALRATYRGESICPPKLCASLFRWFAQASAQFPGGHLGARSSLTLRQRQLVDLMGQGLTNKEIAAKLNLSEFTVRNHVHRILKQVDVGSRREAVDVIRAQMPFVS